MNGGEFGITQLTNNDLANGRLANGRLSDCGQKVRMQYAAILERVCCRLPTCDMEESSAFAGGVMLSDKKVVEQVGTHGGIYARISLS